MHRVSTYSIAPFSGPKFAERFGHTASEIVSGAADWPHHHCGICGTTTPFSPYKNRHLACVVGGRWAESSAEFNNSQRKLVPICRKCDDAYVAKSFWFSDEEYLDVQPVANTDTDQTPPANSAKLSAAAPDMLDALKEIARLVELCENPGVGRASVTKLHEAIATVARAGIWKATGAK